MIIKLYEFEEELTVKGTMEGARFKREEDQDIAFVTPVHYDLTVTKFGSNVRVRGPVDCTLALSCARCLEEFTFPVTTSLDIELTERSNAPQLHEVELTSEEMDLYYYEGDEIDLDPYIYEEVILGIPIKALCSEACKGFCPTCGTNRNARECACEQPSSTLLGEKLKTLLNGR